MNYQPQIKDYGIGLTAILFNPVIGDLYNNPKQITNRLEPWFFTNCVIYLLISKSKHTARLLAKVSRAVLTLPG